MTLNNKLGSILIVDDDPLVLEALIQTFIDEYNVISASSGEEAINKVKSILNIDTIILDIKMADMDGLITASKLKEFNLELPIIFHTGYPGDYSEEEIEKDFHPFDYVGKNEGIIRLKRAVKNAVSFYKLKTSKTDMVDLARKKFGIVGKSKMMLDVYQTIIKIGPTNNKVMILGPTGTGKELVARAIHKQSSQADKPLVIFNCNHKAPDLVESELFGHLKGSFTGAIADRIGMFEYANFGTIFLDEVGDLDKTTQGKILRVIETGEMQRIGSPEIIKVNVRLICATHHDLTKLISENKFREDLYYRLKGVTITLPALKDRREDIPELIDYFTQRYCMKTGDGLKIFEPAARDYLIEFDWPGNVRQLLDTIQSLIDLTPSYYITIDVLKNYLTSSSISTDNNGSFVNQIKEYKKILILKTLDRYNNNVSAAARNLSLDASNLRKIMKNLNIHKG